MNLLYNKQIFEQNGKRIWKYKVDGEVYGYDGDIKAWVFYDGERSWTEQHLYGGGIDMITHPSFRHAVNHLDRIAYKRAREYYGNMPDPRGHTLEQTLEMLRLK